MPLVDPITMSSTTTTTAQASAPAASTPTNALRPVQIRQTPLAQAARHALPALLAGVFAVRFRALVADPVSAMATTLPATVALQVAYAVLCLPVAGGSATAAAARKQKGRVGADGKKRAGGEGGVEGGAVVVGFFLLLFGVLFCVVVSCICVLFSSLPDSC